MQAFAKVLFSLDFLWVFNCRQHLSFPCFNHILCLNGFSMHVRDLEVLGFIHEVGDCKLVQADRKSVV